MNNGKFVMDKIVVCSKKKDKFDISTLFKKNLSLCLKMTDLIDDIVNQKNAIDENYYEMIFKKDSFVNVVEKISKIAINISKSAVKLNLDIIDNSFNDESDEFDSNGNPLFKESDIELYKALLNIENDNNINESENPNTKNDSKQEGMQNLDNQDVNQENNKKLKLNSYIDNKFHEFNDSYKEYLNEKSKENISKNTRIRVTKQNDEIQNE